MCYNYTNTSCKKSDGNKLNIGTIFKSILIRKATTISCMINQWTRFWRNVERLTTFDPIFDHDEIHYNDVIMGAIASQITSLTIVFSIFYIDADQRKHQSSASLAFVRGIHRRPVNSPHKWPVMWKMFPFDDVIMIWWNQWYQSIPLLQRGVFMFMNKTVSTPFQLNLFDGAIFDKVLS